MAYSEDWLSDPQAIRGIFIEATVYNVLTTSEELVYLSSTAYISEDASLVFNPVINGAITLNESLSVDGGINFSFGDIPILNVNGEFDTWLDNTKYVWANRPIQVYLGDPRWQVTDLTQFKTDFLKIFDGLIGDIDSSSLELVNLKIRDKMERLNSPISEEKMGSYGTWAGGDPNEDTYKPIVFGEVHNLSPLLIDPASLEYMINNGTTERLIEVRDNGVPLYTDPTLTSGCSVVDLANGKFELAHPLVGDITVSVQGVKRSIDLTDGSELASYNNNIANLIALITMKFGKQGVTNLTASDIDLPNFSSFASANTQAVGIAVLDRENVLDVCQQLASSIGAQIVFDSTGKLKIIRLGEGFSPTVYITEDDILFGTFSISRKLDVTAGTKIAYCKNWTVQSNLQTGIPEEHKKMFATEWYTATAVDSSTKTLYKLHGEPEQIETLLLDNADASAEASRRNNYTKVQKTIYKFTGKPTLLNVKLGQSVNLTYNRFGLQSGKVGQIYSRSPDWIAGTVTLEVII